MKKYNPILKYIFITAATLLLTVGCVQDDNYDEPNLEGYQCVQDFQANVTLSELKKKFAENNPGKAAYVFPEDKTPNDSSDDLYIQGYVTSTDETGNIYKTIYIQDALENPTHGFTISVDLVSSYTRFPQGSKIYVKLNGLAVGTYGNVVQLGVRTGSESGVNAVSRIPEKAVPNIIFRSCTTRGEIKPLIKTLAELATNEDLIGCLVQLPEVEFDSRSLCSNFAPNGQTVDRGIGEKFNASTKKYTSTAVIRNSGYASFANQTLPAGKGKMTGVYSKFNSTTQLYINKVADLDMEGVSADGIDHHFPRLDLLPNNPCKFSDNGLTAKTVVDVKQLAAGLASGGLVQITGDFYVKGQVTANDESANLFKYLYIEDATGGIKVNINKADLYLDSRFKLGKDLMIKLKGLYIRNVNGELQLGSNDSSSTIGYRIKEEDIYQYLYDSNAPARPVVATEKIISQLTMADVGRWIKIKDVEFINGDLGRTYAEGTNTSNRTLEDCFGNKIDLRTSGKATFGIKTAGAIEVAGGKGDIYAVLSVYNNSYQLWITQLTDVRFNNPTRCDGSVYTPLPVIYSDSFGAGGFGADWTTVNKIGPNQFWQSINQGGNGSNYYAYMNGNAGGANNNFANEDWLISKAVSLVGKSKASVTFTSDVRYSGNAIQIFATDNYTGDVDTTTWTPLQATLDTNTSAFGDWVFSGNIDLSAFIGKNVRIAFKYTSTTSAAATWQIDEFKIKGE
ncbi:hypothetical protein BBI01_15790 [Chryseobacterium artocarpi]|uniref:DUF5689 domain-containing protein n=1 Tax=Chryseobacterium artocarpi TaxID=1414727 RepID=A0A1B8ZD90_9FLAO|nr:DUF5689 domain-containing protein [Chryseobacterium artocarpi]OCA69592.1 hypothetical protein BBI01_15790 [Chryseobacterium artocarpi]